MLRKITQSLIGFNKKGFAPRFFSTAAVVDHGEYTVRNAHPNEFKGIVELRSRELWPEQKLSPADVDAEHFHLISESKSPSFYCIVAVKNGKEEEHLQSISRLYGALDLLVATNAKKDLLLENVPQEWRHDPDTNDDAYITNLAVEPFARRRLVATNLLNFAKEVAKARGMKRIYVDISSDNTAVENLNLKVGYEILSKDDEDGWTVMGLRL